MRKKYLVFSLLTFSLLLSGCSIHKPNINDSITHDDSKGNGVIAFNEEDYQKATKNGSAFNEEDGDTTSKIVGINVSKISSSFSKALIKEKNYKGDLTLNYDLKKDYYNYSSGEYSHTFNAKLDSSYNAKTKELFKKYLNNNFTSAIYAVQNNNKTLLNETSFSSEFSNSDTTSWHYKDYIYELINDLYYEKYVDPTYYNLTGFPTDINEEIYINVFEKSSLDEIKDLIKNNSLIVKGFKRGKTSLINISGEIKEVKVNLSYKFNDEGITYINRTNDSTSMNSGRVITNAVYQIKKSYSNALEKYKPFYINETPKAAASNYHYVELYNRRDLIKGNYSWVNFELHLKDERIILPSFLKNIPSEFKLKFYKDEFYHDEVFLDTYTPGCVNSKLFYKLTGPINKALVIELVNLDGQFNEPSYRYKIIENSKKYVPLNDLSSFNSSKEIKEKFFNWRYFNEPITPNKDILNFVNYSINEDEPFMLYDEVVDDLTREINSYRDNKFTYSAFISNYQSLKEGQTIPNDVSEEVFYLNDLENKVNLLHLHDKESETSTITKLDDPNHTLYGRYFNYKDNFTSDIKEDLKGSSYEYFYGNLLMSFNVNGFNFLDNFKDFDTFLKYLYGENEYYISSFQGVKNKFANITFRGNDKQNREVTSSISYNENEILFNLEIDYFTTSEYYPSKLVTSCTIQKGNNLCGFFGFDSLIK